MKLTEHASLEQRPTKQIVHSLRFPLHPDLSYFSQALTFLHVACHLAGTHL